MGDIPNDQQVYELLRLPKEARAAVWKKFQELYEDDRITDALAAMVSETLAGVVMDTTEPETLQAH